MYQTIHEPIAISGVYQARKFKPIKFKWGAKTLTIEQTTMVTELKDGGVRQRLYSVVVGPNVYRLLFNRDTEEWWLEEVWCE